MYFSIFQLLRPFDGPDSTMALYLCNMLIMKQSAQSQLPSIGDRIHFVVQNVRHEWLLTSYCHIRLSLDDPGLLVGHRLFRETPGVSPSELKVTGKGETVNQSNWIFLLCRGFQRSTGVEDQLKINRIRRDPSWLCQCIWETVAFVCCRWAVVVNC